MTNLSDSYEDLRELMTTSFRDSIAELVGNHADEKFIGFVFHICGDGTCIELCATSEESLARTRLYWQNRRDECIANGTWHGDRFLEELRWECFDWEYDGVGGSSLNATNEQLDKLLSSPELSNDDHYRVHFGRVVASMTLSIMDLTNIGFLKLPAVAYCSSHDSEHTPWLERESVRYINDADAFDLFESHWASRTARFDPNFGDYRSEPAYRSFVEHLANAK